MSAPLLYIAFPLAAGVGLYFLRGKTRLVTILGGIVCFLLAALALLLPIEGIVKIGSLSFNIGSTLDILGRRFILVDDDRTFLFFIYILAGFWFLGARAADTTPLFLPLGMGMMALLVAAIAVEPFLYAALLIETAVLLSIPALSPPGRAFNQGILRFLIFQSLAMPFILFAGWSLAAIEANPSNLLLYPQAEVFLGLGFAFWLAVFPFYSWVPMLAEQAHPYVAGFVLTLLSTIILLLSLGFLDTFAWLRANPALLQVLRLTGLLMVGTAGIWAAFQQNVARLLGYAVIVETGFSLVALSLAFTSGVSLFVQMLLPRAISLAVMALALSVWQKQPGFQGFQRIQGTLRRSPIVSAAFLFSYMSIAGLPLLAGFPSRQILLENMAGQSLSLTFWLVIGNLGFIIGGLRTLVRSAGGEQTEWSSSESLTEGVMLVVGILVLFSVGLFPDAVLPRFLNMLQPFTHLR